MRPSDPAPHAFLSAAPADRAWAETLRRGLDARGVCVCLGLGALERKAPRGPWRETLRASIESAGTIVVLVGHERPPTEVQRAERQAISEAVWSDLRKRLVPVLLRNAVLPAFLRSIYPAGQPIPVYRLRRPRTGWPAAVAALAAILTGRADLRAVCELLDTTEEDRAMRRERFSTIRQIAESLPG